MTAVSSILISTAGCRVLISLPMLCCCGQYLCGMVVALSLWCAGDMPLVRIVAAFSSLLILACSLTSAAAAVDSIHNKLIREMAFNLEQPILLASAGALFLCAIVCSRYDSSCVWPYLNSNPHLSASVGLGAMAALSSGLVISTQVLCSLAVVLINAVDVCVSCTTDNGTMRMYEMSMQLTHKRRMYVHTTRLLNVCLPQELFTHERYADYHVLLGYGDGDIKHIDMRTGAM